MKKIIIIIIFLTNSVAHPQQLLPITTDKTTSLIFPFPIRYVDRGTKEVLVQPVKENENILLVKAATKNFSETNLSVVTADGNVYMFTVSWNERPELFVYELPVRSKTNIPIYSNSILDNKPFLKHTYDRSWNVDMAVTGIYVKDNVLYFQLFLCNRSPIDYDIDVLRFFIRDKKKGKRTAAQENDCVPLYIAGNSKQIKAYGFTSLVIALDKFTIPDAKFLGLQVMEKNGGRNLELKIQNSSILKAVLLPDLH